MDKHNSDRIRGWRLRNSGVIDRFSDSRGTLSHELKLADRL